MNRTNFRRLYNITGCAIAAVVAFSVLRGLSYAEDRIGMAWLLAYLSLIVIALPLILFFWGLNVWAFVREEQHRARYAFIVLVLTVLVTWSIYEYIRLPLP